MNFEHAEKLGKIMCLGLILATALGCMSREDRIKEVILYEIEDCKATEGDFYEVESHDGAKHRILAELCHLEPSDVTMNNEWTGTLTTGPLEWTGGEDQELRAMVITRVAWSDFDRAMRYRNQNNLEEEDFRAAENNFAAAQESYPESEWLRVERLKNLLDLRAETRSGDENPAQIGEEARAYFDELIAWANEEERPTAEARARLAVVDHVGVFRDRQQRGINNLGSRDSRMEAAIEAAKDSGDDETFKAYTEELEERRARRPEAREAMEKRILQADREICELREGLSVTGVDDNSLRSRITSALRQVDCAAVAAAVDGAEEEGADE